MKKKLHDREAGGNTTPRFRGIQLIMVQSCVCLFAILIVLLMRVVSEDTFGALASEFQSTMMNDRIVYANAYTAPVYVEENTVVAPLSDEEEVFAPLQEGVITSGYGERIDPFDESNMVFHHGVDIAAQANSPLYAMRSGRVVYVRDEPDGYGKYVAVSYQDGCRYVYAHCSSIIVVPGQAVKQGDVIAYVGNTGRSTGHHVHVEWIVEEQAIDPMTVLPDSAYV